MIFHRKIANFTSLTLGDKDVYSLPTVSNGLPSVTLEFSLGGWDVESAWVKISLSYTSVKDPTFSSFTLRVQDGYGRTRKSFREEYWLSSNEDPKSFSLRRRDLMSGGSLKDTLVLSGEVTFSGDAEGVLVCGLEQPAAIAAAKAASTPQPLPLLAATPDMLPLLNGEGPPADFELRAAGRSFPAHQVVLWSRSSVFRAMLGSGMLEAAERKAELEGVGADAVERMLVYAYTGAGPAAELTWEAVSELYAAADKYAFMGLRDMCAERLARALDPANAASVLQIADRHADDHLKQKVVQYIYSEDKVAAVVESEHWKRLERDDPQLALEILHKIIRDKCLADSGEIK